MKFKARFRLDEQCLDWIYEAENWQKAKDKAVKKAEAVNLPLRKIERME